MVVIILDRDIYLAQNISRGLGFVSENFPNPKISSMPTFFWNLRLWMLGLSDSFATLYALSISSAEIHYKSPHIYHILLFRGCEWWMDLKSCFFLIFFLFLKKRFFMPNNNWPTRRKTRMIEEMIIPFHFSFFLTIGKTEKIVEENLKR